jgi:pimeloyl-[acyl-carrier protein] methyl ester esterase
MSWFETGSGAWLWYEDCGSGPPIIFIHGWCMSSVVWRLQMEGLSGSSRVIAVDLRGHGQSPPYPGGFSIKGCADDIAELAESLDLRCVMLAGWSLGSMIALEAAAVMKERLSGLVLIAGTPRFVQGDGYASGLSRNEADGMARKVQRSLERALEGFADRMFAPAELDDPKMAARIGDLLSEVPLPTTEAALQALQALVGADLRDRLDSIDLPVLIVNGDRDVICLPQASEYLARRIPFSRQVLFAACGHAPFLTDSNRFNSCLKEFRDQVYSEHAH